MEAHTAVFGRADVERLLRAEREGVDFSDDAAFYTQIVNDYEDYARLLADEAARKAEIEAALRDELAGDGVPYLGGSAGGGGSGFESLFDLARGVF